MANSIVYKEPQRQGMLSYVSGNIENLTMRRKESPWKSTNEHGGLTVQKHGDEYR